MNSATLDSFGIGNALLDVEYRITDAFLTEHAIEKRHMTLVDEKRMLLLIDALESEAITSTCGGSAANTMWAMCGFGLRTHLTCRVAPDEAGQYFVSQLTNAGISTNKILPEQDGVTGRCLVLVTEDAERTMNTCLGVSERLLAIQVDEGVLRNSRSIFIEGYLASSKTGSAAALYAREIADAHDLETNLTLADTSMVTMFRAELDSIVGQGLTRVFCNAEEAFSWCKTDRLDIALTELKDVAEEVIITLGPKGCAVNTGRERFESKAFPVRPIDLNGAGDMFAAAYLSKIIDNNAKEAANFANFAASHIIQRTGARFETISKYGKIKKRYLRNQETESVA
ncbi:MAG: adenosine kinase [Gammaproteobacteria bacterium]|nr:adenosine kinase [Gammaproteobacteria bacterium]